MINREEVIGDYTSKLNVSKEISSYSRKHMVLLIEELYSTHRYTIETLFLAVSIADRYLIHTVAAMKETPCMVTLAIASILLAAKLEQNT